MKIRIDTVMYQLYIFPYLKITYDKYLNGNYEIILGWLRWEIVLEIPHKNKNMKKLLLIFTILSIVSCTKEQTPVPINPLIGNWRGPLKMGPNLYEFTNDSMFEYVDSSDLLYYNGYTIKGDTLNITGAYMMDWGKKSPYDTSYSIQFIISNDSLYINGTYKGKKF